MKKKNLHFPASMFLQHRVGSTHQLFGVPRNKKLPKTYLQAVVNAPLMTRVKNPTNIGKPEIKVTRLVKARANGILNAIRLTKR
jgi:hypothetical protein